ncbi:MAG: hypothetical protein OXD50_14095 [Chloroflexi bacterium]|nr:hypothetical protein [Chloroflexota bacterium]
MSGDDLYNLSGNEFEVLADESEQTVNLRIVANRQLEMTFPLSVSEAQILADQIQQAVARIRRTEDRA